MNQNIIIIDKSKYNSIKYVKSKKSKKNKNKKKNIDNCNHDNNKCFSTSHSNSPPNKLTKTTTDLGYMGPSSTYSKLSYISNLLELAKRLKGVENILYQYKTNITVLAIDDISSQTINIQTISNIFINQMIIFKKSVCHLVCKHYDLKIYTYYKDLVDSLINKPQEYLAKLVNPLNSTNLDNITSDFINILGNIEFDILRLIKLINFL